MDSELEDTLADVDAEDAEQADDGEAERIFRWRLDTLTGCGYDYGLAFKLAMRPSVDLHAATRLVEQGCPHHTAAQILL